MFAQHGLSKFMQKVLDASKFPAQWNGLFYLSTQESRARMFKLKEDERFIQWYGNRDGAVEVKLVVSEYSAMWASLRVQQPHYKNKSFENKIELSQISLHCCTANTSSLKERPTACSFC